MEINNLKEISELLKFETSLDFYFIQIIKRKREHPIMPKSERLINSYFIYSLEDLYDKWTDITEDVVANGARAYIWINRRNDETIALQTLKLIAENIVNKSFKIRKSYLSACGQFNSEPDKKWIVDFDFNLSYNLAEVKLFINALPPHGDKIIAEIQTPNGVHIISKPFDLKQFRKKYDIDVQKDNPTILYFNFTKIERNK